MRFREDRNSLLTKRKANPFVVLASHSDTESSVPIISSATKSRNTLPTNTMSEEDFQELVLALNAGSSSLKASVIDHDKGTLLVAFLAERLSTPDASIRVDKKDSKKTITPADGIVVFDHGQALSRIIEYLRSEGLLEKLVAVGHRVVHGGARFSGSCLITEKTLEQIKSISHLAPL